MFDTEIKCFGRTTRRVKTNLIRLFKQPLFVHVGHQMFVICISPLYITKPFHLHHGGWRDHIPPAGGLETLPIDIDGVFAFVCGIGQQQFDSFSEICNQRVIVMLLDNVSGGGLTID